MTEGWMDRYWSELDEQLQDLVQEKEEDKDKEKDD